MITLIAALVVAQPIQGPLAFYQDAGLIGQFNQIECRGPSVSCFRNPAFVSRIVIQSSADGGGGGGAGGGADAGSFPMNTTGPVTLFVDQAGSDSNTCLAPGAAACRTDQGALNKLPKILYDPVTIWHPDGGGNYGCFVVSGFQASNRAEADAGSTGGYILMHAPQSVSTTLATGSATGTSTSGTAGSGTTFGTLVDTTQAWTVNDLQGRFAMHGTQFLPIVSNTATSLTVAGTWTAPTTTAYEIQDNKTVINNACTFAAVANAAGTSLPNYAAILTAGVDFTTRQGAIRLSGYRFENTTGFAIARQGNASLIADRMQYTAALTGTSHIIEAVPATGQSSYNSSSSIYPGTTNTHFATGSAGIANILNVYMKGGAIGVQYSTPTPSLILSTQMDGFNSNGLIASRGAAIQLSSVVMNGNAPSRCILYGASTTAIPPTPASIGSTTMNISGLALSGCAVGIQGWGKGANATLAGAVGTVGNAYNALQGASIRVTASSTLAGMPDGGSGIGKGNDIDLDSDAYSLVDMRAGTPKAVTDGIQGSAVFE